MQVVVLSSAKDDLRDGYFFYERQGGAYLGNYFLASLHSQLGCLLEFRDISVDEDGNIFLKLQMKASGGTVDLNPCIQANSK